MSQDGAISGKRVGTLLAARVIPAFVTLLVYAMVSRAGGPGALGLYYFAYNFVALFQILANFGYDSFLMREVAKTPERTRALLNNSIAILLPYGVALAVAMPLLVRTLGYSREIVDPLWAGALALPCMAIAYALEAVLIGQERFPALLAGSTLDGTLRMALSLAALQGGYGTRGLLLSLAIARASAVVFYLACLARSPGFLPLDLRVRMLAEPVRGAGPFFAMYIAYAIAVKLDGALLPRFATKADGDAYSIPKPGSRSRCGSSREARGRHDLPLVMARAAGTPALGAIVTRCLRLFLLASIPAAAILSSYPAPVLVLLAGSRNAGASARVLAPIVWTIVPLTLNEPALRGLLASNGQRASMVNSVVVLMSAAALFTWGVLSAGAVGAARALPVVITIDVVLNLAALARRTDLSGVPRALAPIAASGALSALLLVWLAPLAGPAAIPLFLACYGALLVASRSVSLEELRDPRRMLSA
ncbi:MAG: oligosaccharide flippase family protein [Acidobacteriota bacterium]